MYMIPDNNFLKETTSNSRRSDLRVAKPGVPDPEVLERPRRKRFTAEYKLRILKEIDAAARWGEVGAILRREGLYSSHIAAWRKQKEKGELDGLSQKKRGPKAARKDALAEKRLEDLEKENRRLQRHLKRAEIMLDIQKKISEITGIPLKDLEFEEDDL